jgi:hypothetical protein
METLPALHQALEAASTAPSMCLCDLMGLGLETCLLNLSLPGWLAFKETVFFGPLCNFWKNGMWGPLKSLFLPSSPSPSRSYLALSLIGVTNSLDCMLFEDEADLSPTVVSPGLTHNGCSTCLLNELHLCFFVPCGSEVAQWCRTKLRADRPGPRSQRHLSNHVTFSIPFPESKLQLAQLKSGNSKSYLMMEV